MNQKEIVMKQMDFTVNKTDYKIGKKYQGKVRDIYDLGDKLLIITTDRISAFDRVLTTIPFKGEILNNLSLFWFEQTKDIIQNHIIKQVNSNAVLVKKCKIIPIEIIVRGFLTGGGYREYEKTGKISGIELPKNMKKDTKFERPILTPTTKATEGHDLPISVKDIIEQKIIAKDLMEKIESIAIKLFLRGQEIVAKNNLILVDTKYEFGLTENNELMLCDEIHTSDSSRYWYLDTYEKLYSEGKEQKMLDKEYFRQFLLSKNYSGYGAAPEIPFDIKYGVFERYKTAYETITGKEYFIENKNSIILLEESIKKI